MVLYAQYKLDQLCRVHSFVYSWQQYIGQKNHGFSQQYNKTLQMNGDCEGS